MNNSNPWSLMWKRGYCYSWHKHKWVISIIHTDRKTWGNSQEKGRESKRTKGTWHMVLFSFCFDFTPIVWVTTAIWILFIHLGTVSAPSLHTACLLCFFAVSDTRQWASPREQGKVSFPASTVLLVLWPDLAVWCCVLTDHWRGSGPHCTKLCKRCRNRPAPQSLQSRY